MRCGPSRAILSRPSSRPCSLRPTPRRRSSPPFRPMRRSARRSFLPPRSLSPMPWLTPFVRLVSPPRHSMGRRRSRPAGPSRVVANCAVLTEGFDEPSVDCILVARPTQSALLYQQMLGRGTRTYPGKTDCLVLDVVGVSTRHTLYTAATLFACDAATLAQRSVLESLAVHEGQPQEEDAITGTLRSAPVDLFARRALRWVQTRQGAWVLSLGAQHGTLRLRADGPGTWQVVQVRRDADPVLLGDTLPLPYAQGLAEDYARHLGVARLVEAEAPWRRQPATEKQTALLRKLGLVTRAGLTKGEAAELLAAVLGDWD